MIWANYRVNRFILIGLFSFLSACALTEKNYAPVTLGNTIEAVPKKGIYEVKKNETLYSIAWRYGLDYRTLAKRNHIKPPYRVQTGEQIYLRGKAPLTRPITVSTTIKPKVIKPLEIAPVIEKEPVAAVKRWNWPAHGSVVSRFSAMNKGINISGRLNDPIYATAAGKVVYSGNGLRGYGNLIIIKHNSSFLTAYAYNKTVYVKTGDWVSSGQKIAEMGNSESKRAMLHFEIRRNGRPVNPLSYLNRNL